MDLSKKRRENNTKRVGSAIRGNEWPLNKESVHVIPRTADKVEPKKPESGSPKHPEYDNRDWHRPNNPEPRDGSGGANISSGPKPKSPHRPNPEEGKPRGGYGGSPVKPKPKPKSPSDPASKEIPTIKKHSPEYNRH